MAMHAFSAPATESHVKPAAHQSSSGARVSILSIGNDHELLRSRAAILRLTGGRVRSAEPDDVPALVAREQFSLAVFGHTLSTAEIEELVAHFRLVSPGTRLLATCFDPQPARIERLFDACVQSTAGPAALIRSVRALLPALKASYRRL